MPSRAPEQSAMGRYMQSKQKEKELGASAVNGAIGGSSVRQAHTSSTKMGSNASDFPASMP